MDSIWVKEANKPRFSLLEGNRNTEVLIVGGGIAGILCAYRLKNAGVDCVLTEQNEICGGVTQNTTAKITFAHGLIYNRIKNRYGINTAKKYLSARVKACGEYARIVGEIDCGYEKKDSYVYSLSGRKKIEDEITALNSIGIKAEFSETPSIPVKTEGAVLVRDQAQFQPLKFLFELAKDLPIFEHTKVKELGANKAVTGKGEIRFKKLIIATHFPILNKHGLYPLKLCQHRSYVIALRGAQDVNGIYVDESDRGLSFRNFDGLLLLGGGGHRTGKQGGCWQELEAFAAKHYKNAEIAGKWATQDCMTLDGIPYVGQYGRTTPNMFVATGFNKWGMSNAMVAADILCDLVLEKQNPYADVFDPSRTVLHPQLAVNAFESAVGIITPTAPRCPHLGCALKYNKAERTWDCPCHGSRFSESGEVINNPATGDHPSIR
ncbi:MAG: FAD-dependent oxidoreductase [Clostridia bacterium]|nr:FAD-dependent oxidoreductase [Clostridia bacterium]